MAANPATGDTSLKATGGLYDAPPPLTGMQKLAKAFGVDLNNPAPGIGSGIGGLAGSAIGERLFPSTYKPPSQSRDSFSSGPSLYQPRSAPVFPTSEQLRNYGRSGQFNFYPV